MNGGKLYIVPTPIGNLSDITIRALDVLKKTNIIIAEDTRITKKLLNHYQIKSELISYHKFNESKRVNFILDLLKSGKIISLVSDAGTPLLSDPGFVIVKEVIKQGFNVEALPGPSSILPSLILSGFNPERFLFYGFLNKKSSIRNKEIKEIGKIPYPVILFESPLRIMILLEEILNILGDREVAIIKELTKIYESVMRGKISEVSSLLNKENLKGEFVLILGPCKEITADTKSEELNEKINFYLKTGKTKKEIVGIISDEFGIKRNDAYKIVHNKQEVH
jgi:16S rRNA (cytidine1402-2'-O)-methyltransferase